MQYAAAVMISPRGTISGAAVHEALITPKGLADTRAKQYSTGTSMSDIKEDVNYKRDGHTKLNVPGKFQ